MTRQTLTMIPDLLLVMTLGFLGSFGHCVGMCAPLTVAFSLSQRSDTSLTWQQHFYFHSWLNFGRILSYVLVGAGIGALGSVLIAGGQFAGIDSGLRRGLAVFTGILLVWMGLLQINPKLLPQMPLLHPLSQGKLHQWLSQGMMHWSETARWWTPALLGMTWGLIPCGFLYTAQIKAAETGNLWQGMTTMLAFGLGTLPSMLLVGVSTARLSHDRRSQLFRLGGWVTLVIGLLTLWRSGEMVDYTGHASLFCLMLVLVARPISRLWVAPLRYRRVLGVGAYLLALAHIGHMLVHTFNWNLQGLPFMLPIQQLGIWAGVVAVALLTPAALTSFDRVQRALGDRWRKLHLLSLPALLLGVIHTLLIGSNYLGALNWHWRDRPQVWLLSLVTLVVLLIRNRWAWSLVTLEKFYGSPTQSK